MPPTPSDTPRPARGAILRLLPVPRAMETAWGPWQHAAEFHHRTKDAAYVSDLGEPRRAGLAGPPPLKTVEGSRYGLDVERSPPTPLAATLVARRTWRNFGEASVPLEAIALLCQYTFGVQSWIETPDKQRQALKTSPSGGARHSVEAYLVALRVADLPPGVYHYGPDEHALVLLDTGFGDDSIRRCMPAQPCFWQAGGVFFLTSRFDRVQARYDHSRAYRTILTELGHLGQTFCLLATELGLAPFTTMAIADSTVDRLLGVDGIHESVLYAVGVGSVPEDGRPIVADGMASPTLVPPTYLTDPDD